MSAWEQDCRWTLVYAYAAWKWRQRERPLTMLAYARWLGLEVP